MCWPTSWRRAGSCCASSPGWPRPGAARSRPSGWPCWRGIADASDDIAAQAVDFAWATELAQAAGNLVFLLILNAIRALYFEHAASLPVTARREELAPFYERAARAIGEGTVDEARATVEELAAAQRERVESAVAGAGAAPEDEHAARGAGP